MPEYESWVEYRDVPGFQGYKVDNTGELWSCWKRVGHGNGGGSHLTIGEKWKRLKLSRQKTGHLTARLYPGNHRWLIHRLVLEVFSGPCPEGMEGRHYPDRSPGNNHVENLSWSTPKQNQADKVGHGTHVFGEQIRQAKLTEKQVVEIRSRIKSGTSCQSLSEIYKVSRSNISFIVQGKTWRHLLPTALNLAASINERPAAFKGPLDDRTEVEVGGMC